MFGLPKCTEFNKRIPKQKFYENLTVTPALKQAFVEQIKLIYWTNKIAPATLNLASGNIVAEIEFIEMRLAVPDIDVAILKQIDKEIPYHIIFLLEYEGKYKAVTAYKEETSGAKSAFKVGVYYQTDWLLKDDLPLAIDGLYMDTVYENFVRQIAGDKLSGSSCETLKESVEKSQMRQQLQAQINALTIKMKKEKQLNKQMELSAEIKKLKRELGGL